MEAQEWVNRLRSTVRARHRGRDFTSDDTNVPRLSAPTIADIMHLASSLYAAAMREDPPIVLSSPFAGLELPTVAPRPVEFYEPEEAAGQAAAAGKLSAKRQTMIELGMPVGLRPGEMCGLHGHRVDWLRGQLLVVDVMTRKGLRQWPKSKRSYRSVPVPPPVLAGMSGLMTG
jgi:integrase